MELKEYIDKELAKLEKSIVATPATRERLDNFAKSNNGEMDYLLTQMAVQFGYKLAMEEILEINKKYQESL